MHWRPIGLLFSLVLWIGCGSSTTAIVSGKVLYQGEALPSGTIAFQGDKGWIGSSNIQSGDYRIEGVPAGEVKITVQTFPPSPSVVPPNTPASSVQLPSLKFVEIPQRYADFGTTPLRFKVEPGNQTHEVVLSEK